MHSEWLSALQVGDDSPAGANKIVRCNREHVVPCSRRGPHLVVCQQIRIDEDPKRPRKTKRRHAAVGFGNTLLASQAFDKDQT